MAKVENKSASHVCRVSSQHLGLKKQQKKLKGATYNVYENAQGPGESHSTNGAAYSRALIHEAPGFP